MSFFYYDPITDFDRFWDDIVFDDTTSGRHNQGQVARRRPAGQVQRVGTQIPR